MRTKYWAKKTTIDGIVFDSKSESDFYMYLKHNPDVRKFTLQPVYILQPSFKHKGKSILPIKYVSDFEIEYKDWSKVVVDIKWLPTQASLLKRKMFMYTYKDIELQRIVKYKWTRVDYFENEKRKKLSKKIMEH